jgi:large subunit ribosomal protein L24
MENKKATKNVKLHIKTGDTVLIIAGDQKGEKGKIVKVFPSENKAIVEGFNMVKRHVKPNAQVPGGIVEKEAPIHISNLMLVDSNGESSRISRVVLNGKKVRISKKTKEVIE